MMIKIGITGQAGFMGTHLYNYLSLKKDQFQLIPFEDDYFLEQEKLHEFVKKCDCIIHLAALNRHSEETTLYNTNLELVDKLINGLRTTGSKAHIIFSSSTQESKDNVYGKSKREGRKRLYEWSVQNNSGFTGLIIPNVFGPFGNPFYNSVISTFSYQLIKGETPKIEIDAALNLIYVGELIEEIDKIILKRSGKIDEECFIKPTSTITVSGVLQKLECFFSEYINNGYIPALKDKFEINLFNTFRSYIPLDKYYPVKYKNNVDERGNFVELVKLRSGGQVSFSTTKPGVVRGNHFHTRKIERFSVIKGEALIQLRKFNTEEVINIRLSGIEPSYVDMPIWYAHNIKNTGDDELLTVFWINEFYDPDDPDTFSEVV
jgi:UDP-2-acetamido-2,6-beta-L-arabino-hexul-4-ose reductase